MATGKWLGRLSPRHAAISAAVFRRFLAHLEGIGSLPGDADALLSYQREHRGYEVLDALQAWVISDPAWTVNYKRVLYCTVRSFFLHNRAELPRDPSFTLHSTKPKTRGTLTVDDARRLLASCNPLYRAVFTCMLMGGMGIGELLHWSNHGWASLQAQLEDRERYVKVDLPGRKAGRNIRSFYTFLGRDAQAALRDHLAQRGDAPGAVFMAQTGEPMKEVTLRRYWTRHLVRLGLIEPTGEKGSGIRYGKNPHELRDLFRTRWHMSGADGKAAEFFMGHTVDPLEYNRAFDDVDYARGQYAKAEPWLNIVSEEPEKISRAEADIELRRQREEFERNVALVVRRELAKERLKRRE